MWVINRQVWVGLNELSRRGERVCSAGRHLRERDQVDVWGVKMTAVQQRELKSRDFGAEGQGMLPTQALSSVWLSQTNLPPLVLKSR